MKMKLVGNMIHIQRGAVFEVTPAHEHSIGLFDGLDNPVLLSMVGIDTEEGLIFLNDFGGHSGPSPDKLILKVPASWGWSLKHNTTTYWMGT